METRSARHDVIAIGGSLGSVDALKHLCAQLPADLPAAVLVVVHVCSLGKNLLADIFDRNSPLAVSTAEEGEPVHAGHVYVAPADRHLLTIDRSIRLGRGPRENMARPAIDPLFRSVGVEYGSRAIGLVLTGLLDDGAAGLSDLKRCGGLTMVQNPGDAAAPDMPLAALRSSECRLSCRPRRPRPAPQQTRVGNSRAGACHTGRHPSGGRDRSGTRKRAARDCRDCRCRTVIVPGMRRRSLRDQTPTAALPLSGGPRL